MKPTPEIIIQNPDMKDWTQLQKWHYFLGKKHQQFEKAYYPLMDDLTQKLCDTPGINPNYIPNFDRCVDQFSFIKEWLDGDCTSESVLEIMRPWGDCRTIAISRLTRKLHSFAERKKSHQSYDMMVAVEKILMDQVVPIYATYLVMLRTYIQKCAQVDAEQMKVSWVDQFFPHGVDGGSDLTIHDYNLNQVIRQLEFHVEPYNHNRYRVGDNVVVFDEEIGTGIMSCHWIFGPKEYISEIAARFKVVESIDLESEKEYVQKIIGAFVK